jgi:hypothetical protein
MEYFRTSLTGDGARRLPEAEHRPGTPPPGICISKHTDFKIGTSSDHAYC